MKKTGLIIMCWLCLTQLVVAQTLTVTGQVTDANDNYGVPGANVIVKGTQVGTITDFDGNYSLEVKKGDVIVCSFIGYKSQEQKVEKAGTINFVLQTDNLMLDEVVAIGYGTMRKSDLTGAVSSVKADQLQKNSCSRCRPSFTRTCCRCYRKCQ